MVDVDDETLLKTVEGWSRISAPTEWIKVAFADVLAREIARKKGQPIPRPAAPNTGDAAATSLDGWIPRITPASGPTDRYVANTVDWMMQEIVDEVGVDAVRQLITRVVIDQRSSYGVDLTTSSVGSHLLLDLLEYDARSTKTRPLFDKYVFPAGPTSVEWLAARPAARARYEALVAAAGEWRLPAVIPQFIPPGPLPTRPN